MEEDKKIDQGGWNNHENSELEQMRRALLTVTSENTLLKENVADLEKQKYELMKKIKELTDAPCCGAGPRAEKVKQMKENDEVPNLQ